MKSIRFSLTVFAFLMVSGLSAQEIQPKFEKQGDLMKGTFYYEDGNIRQEGTYKDRKLHGKWVSYDQNGKKNAVAQYREGVKMGKWFFWSADAMTEVHYDTNKIINVKEQKTRPTG